jgi:hemolysin III
MSAPAETGQCRASELAADRIIHMVGVFAGAIGAATLMGIAANIVDGETLSATLLYSVCLVTMLVCSAAYNLASKSPRHQFLRRVDHAAIFLMIAGTYTPFTTCRLHGLWAVGMTAAVWTGALAGAVIKLICPSRIERVSVAAYLALGWIILVGMRPLLASVNVWTAVLLAVGGALYSIGVGFFLWRTLPFQTAIWHGFVLAAAGCHYAAVLDGVVLARS